MLFSHGRMVYMARLRRRWPYPAFLWLALSRPFICEDGVDPLCHRNYSARSLRLALRDENRAVAAIGPCNVLPFHAVQFIRAHASIKQHGSNFGEQWRGGGKVTRFIFWR